VVRSVVFTVVLAAAFVFTATAAAPGEHFAPILAELTPPAILRGVGRLFLASDRGLIGESEDRVNVLILGIGGEGHDGPQLTDTMILVSYQPSTKKVAFISIPRDMLVEVPHYGWRKINAVNAYAESEEKGSGPKRTAEALSGVLGVQIPYYVRVDFAGFKELVDKTGGVLVYVERPFTDLQYPTADDKVQTVSFKSGWQRMDGATALVFARSRHGNNFEGSDFARSRRQQKIITAFKDELMSAGTIADPTKLISMLGIVSAHVATDFEPWEIVRLASVAKDADAGAAIRKTLDSESGGPLVPADANGAYVLVPKDGNYSAVRKIVADVFSETATPAQTAASSIAPTQGHSVRIEIQNGTDLTGYATKAADSLKGNGFTVGYVGNAPSHGYERTVIYDLSGGRYGDELAKLRKLLDADVSVTIPEWFASGPLPPSLTMNPPTPVGGKNDADFLIILGKSSVSLVGPS